ncbi:shufflon system plasmid conjugative transfer pilus tip adhesin PilV [Burkholderia sp. R-70006]|uniref:shufflon system plasmid conjugative transfer pilus tip adhesin PilV n=1 Tax=Paraburkholderia domus TaxID=2793075 RepID=UPI00191457A4|nr:shufflon system plasmid conjugative transfer pilus tip adhesin PilV [Paraburkholderia domus]MBK5051796.1 shufflon system plasmid conjugative transfer pilus tip adhesin PilV [Burkholderia sp. R-70006]
MIAVVGVLVYLMVMAAPYAKLYGDNRQDTLIANQFSMAMQGANTFVKNNPAAIIAAAGPTVVYSWAQIASSMPAGLSATNQFGQTYQLAVLVTGVAPNQVINPMLQTVGGNPIPENELRTISKIVGGSGGYVSSLTPTVATGAQGGWGPLALATYGANPGSGRLAGALFYQNAANQGNQYLYRSSVAGQPQLNQMQTAIDMNGSNINNAATVNATTANVQNPDGSPYVQLGNSYVSNANSVGQLFIQANGGVNVVNAAGSGWTQVAAGNVVSNGSLSVAGTAAINGNTTMGANTGIYNPATQYIDTGNGSNLYLKPWTAGTTIVGGGGGSGNLTATGTVTANNVVTPAGNGVQVGGSYVFSDGTNSAMRQNGMLYVQNTNGTANANVWANDYFIAAVGRWASQMTSPSGSMCGFSDFGAGSGVEQNSTPCQGLDPYYNGCPAGYWLSNVGAISQHWLYSCIKS